MPTATPAHDVNLTTLAPKGDALLGEINQLREYQPIYWSELSHCWIVTGHTEVTEGFSGTLPLSSHQMPQALYRILPPDQLNARIPNSLRYMPLIATNLDGEVHANLRKILVKALNRKLVEDQRPYVRARVALLLDQAAARRELEFHEEIARQLPGAVILKLLGMSPDYLASLKRWADGVTTALTSYNPKPEWLDQLEIVVNDMLEIFRAEIEDRRKNPRADLITLLLNTTEGDARLSMDEVLGTLIQVIIAGHDTTNNSLTLGMRALARHPEAWAWWRAHPDKSLECTNELMRYIAMSTVLYRIAAEDFNWRGSAIRKGDMVTLMIAGANRDPRVFANPEVLDFTRQTDLSMTFGPGLHHCVGHLLAKLQLSEFFGALVQRFDRVEILAEPEFTPGLVFRSLKALQVRFHPRQDA